MINSLCFLRQRHTAWEYAENPIAFVIVIKFVGKRTYITAILKSSLRSTIIRISCTVAIFVLIHRYNIMYLVLYKWTIFCQYRLFGNRLRIVHTVRHYVWPHTFLTTVREYITYIAYFILYNEPRRVLGYGKLIKNQIKHKNLLVNMSICRPLT